MCEDSGHCWHLLVTLQFRLDWELESGGLGWERVQSPGTCRVRKRQKTEPGKSGRSVQNTVKN